MNVMQSKILNCRTGENMNFQSEEELDELSFVEILANFFYLA